MKTDKKTFKIVFSAAIIILNIIYIAVILRGFVFVNKFPNSDNLPYTVFVALIAILPMISAILLLRTGKEVLKVIVSIIMIIAILFNFPIYYLMDLFPPSISKTTNIKNYLQTDSDFPISNLDFFPKEIPKEATEIKYYYFSGRVVEVDRDIFAKWRLPKELYLKEKERILNSYKDIKTIERDNFSEVMMSNASGGGRFYKLFFYFDEECTVAYTYFDTLDGVDLVTPHFADALTF